MAVKKEENSITIKLVLGKIISFIIENMKYVREVSRPMIEK